MKPVESKEQIEEMRRRLYDRSGALGNSQRHDLSDTKIDVSRNWDVNKKTPIEDKPPLKETEAVPRVDKVEGEPPVQNKNRGYRRFVFIGSLIIFVVTAGLASLFLYFGGNQISSSNIALEITGPGFIGGGEVVDLQITVQNQNEVTLNSVNLILKYPAGTRSVEDSPRNLYEERIPLDDIEPGEIIERPLKVAVFGEEGSEKTITAALEYRVEGSNGTFSKDSVPVSFKISSSPLVLRIENLEKVASGQVVDVTMTAVSNASTPLTDLLIYASYPNGFTFEKSDPDPVFGQNVWKIDELLPEEEISIEVQGVVTGLTEETFRINFSTGPADPDNPYMVGSTLAEGTADFLIERPFINIDLAVNQKTGPEVVLAEGADSDVIVNITNTLDETVYDMIVEVIPAGNALSENSIRSSSGFYDSNNETVRWEVSNNSSFDRILPGDSRQLQFSVRPGTVRTTASYDLVVNVYARRVAETSAQETLIGTKRIEAKYSSNVQVGSQASRSSGQITDIGPIPPKVGETTTYTVTVVAEAGANDITNGVIETSLPLYVEWLDNYSAEGEVIYNSVSKKIQWNVGNVSARERKELTFQVGIKPSTSQVGSNPTLINSQSMRANDRFTGALLQDSSPAVTTELSTEMGFAEDNGRVNR